MPLNNLTTAIDALELSLLKFPIGTKTKDDFKSLEEKIADLKESLKAINARRLTMQAVINSNDSKDLSEKQLHKSFKKLNEHTTNYLIHRNALLLCYQSKGIQDILYKNAGSIDVQETVHLSLKKIFFFNDGLLLKYKKKKELLEKLYRLKLKFHEVIYDYQDYLKEKEIAKKKHLEETNPKLIEIKNKIDRFLFKIYTMKRLIINLIACMIDKVYKNDAIIDLLSKHKKLVDYNEIKEEALKISHNTD